MARLYKPTVTRWLDPATGRRVPSTTPGAVRRTETSKTWRGEWRDADGTLVSRSLSPNKAAATVLLGELVRKAAMGKAGASDPFDDHKRRPIDEHVAAFGDHLTAERRTPKHVALTLSRLRALVEACGFRRLGDLDADVVATHLADRRAAGMAVQTTNYILSAAKSFGTWLVGKQRLAVNPFAQVRGLNAATDRRLQRRTLSSADLAKLLRETRTSTATFRGLTGADRHALYLLACRSGLRAAELASLRPSSVTLDDDPPSVRIAAADEKARRGAELPIPADVARSLREWCVERGRGADDAVLWPGTWSLVAAKMLRADLDRAGIPFRDAAGRVFDFHSLRAQFITDLGRAGVPLTTAQKLARHSDPKLTAVRYTHLHVSDLSAAVESLPSLEAPQAQTLRATGTDGAFAVVAGLVAGPGGNH